jgi:1,2-diacylglycerol 3-alpha-glucosyltransferase
VSPLSSRPPVPSQRPVRVFFPCTGLGRQRRGFETFTLECAEALRGDPRLAVTVFSGRAVSGVDTRVRWSTARDGALAALAGRLVRHDPYFVEQATFFLSLLPALVLGRPDVVFYSDLNLGNLCWHWRRLSGQRYRMLYSNGAPTTQPFTRTDFVQQVTPAGFDSAVARGESPDRQTVLAYGLRLPDSLPPRITGEARIALGLPADRPVVLSVAALDVKVKRTDYLIREIAALPEPRPFLCLLGGESPDADALRALAASLLGDDVLIRAVPRESIGDYYRAADLFALASQMEGFGLVYAEALAHGLPVVAHDFPVARFVTGGLASLTDLTPAGAGARAISDALGRPMTEEDREARHASVRARFGWDTLRERYVEMLLRVAELPR